MKKLILLTAFTVLFITVRAQWMQLASNTDGHLRQVQFTSPNNGHVVFQLGSYGGTLRTTDGISWSDQLLSFAPFTSIHFGNSDTGLVGGAYGMMMKSTDAGVTWDISNINSPTTYTISDIHYIDPSTCIISTYSSEVYKTVNGGSSWSMDTINIGVAAIDFTTNTTGYFAGSDYTFQYRGAIAKTTDQGATFSYYYVPENYTQLNGIHFPSTTTGYAAGEHTIIKTTDAGVTWTMLNVDSNEVYNDVFFVSNTTGYAVTQTGLIFKTTDGGASWFSQFTGTTHSLNSIYCTDANTCYAVGDSGVILKTTNGGGVGINEFYNGANITTYPNPFSDQTTVSIQGTDLNDAVLNLYDLSGREVAVTAETRNNSIILNRSGLQAGMYFFTVNKDGVQEGAGKLVIE